MSTLIGFPFRVASRLRHAAYAAGLLQAERLAGPVISVGNLASGGRGKTPVVARIASWLREDGHAVAVLSRGYRGAFRGDLLIVSDGERTLATAAEAGDEPVMLAQELPGVVVAVGKRRAQVGRAVSERFGPRAFVLDDGFQHLALARDLDIVCVAPQDVTGTPSDGWLREGKRALDRADLILLLADDGPEEGQQALRQDLGASRTFLLRRRSQGFFGRDRREKGAPRRPYLLAGIARPERFLADVRALSGETAGSAFFRDHHAFREAELLEVARKAGAAGADALVTTAKDEVRLPAAFAPPGLPVLVLRVGVEIENDGALRERLRQVARRAA